MKIINKNQILLEDESELIALQTMLEDLPYYLKLDGVNNSALAEMSRIELLELIDKVFVKHRLSDVQGGEK